MPGNGLAISSFNVACKPLYTERPTGNNISFAPTFGLIPGNAAGEAPTRVQGSPPHNTYPESRPLRAKSLIFAPAAIVQLMSAQPNIVLVAAIAACAAPRLKKRASP